VSKSSASFAKTTKCLASLGKVVVIPVTAAATAVIGGAVSQGANLEQSIGGVETLFKGDAGVVKANADAAYKTAGFLQTPTWGRLPASPLLC